MAHSNGNFLPFMQYEMKSIQKVQEWLRSLQGCGSPIDWTMCNEDDEEGERGEFKLRSEKSLPNVLRPTGKVQCKQKKVNENNTSQNESESELCIKKWTIKRFSSNGVILKGQLTSLNTGKIIKKDYLAGSVLSRPKPNQVRTSKGLFTLVGGVQDPQNEIPSVVRKYFSDAFPSSWKSIIADHWRHDNSLDCSSNLEDSDYLFDNERLKEPENPKRNGDISLNDNSKQESSSYSIGEMVPGNLNLNEEVVEDKRKSQNQQQNKINSIESSTNELFLKNWTVENNSRGAIILKGNLYSMSAKKTATEEYVAGPVLARIDSNRVKTEKGIFTLVGQLQDSKNVLPEEIKNKFVNSFPRTWRKVLNGSWCNKAEPKVVESKLTGRRVKRKPTSPESPTVPAKIEKVEKVTESRKDKAQRKVNKRSTISTKRKSFGVSRKMLDQDRVKKRSPVKSKKSKTKKNVKKKNIKEETVVNKENGLLENFVEDDENPFNFTRNNTFGGSSGIGVINSFQEISLGGCLRSVKKNNEGLLGEETPSAKRFAWDVYKNCTTSSLHSANSSNVAANTTGKQHCAEIGKRVQRLNKAKKKLNKSRKNKEEKTRRYGSKEVNEVFKQITKSNRIAVSTPKVIKKVFRKRTPRDSDNSFPSSSSDDRSSENDFL